ncbi:hypothetical protein [Parendozoicomonas haliclonae]|uniref:Uncharacterized protein n=1 Tax=Parendozoicomonas haliclonae TaxID=1960125 RepID=A0A1X7AJY0_9GAMM|nr:hypothetical protein [Parendozoicomonas haliclonae]SMA47365.1 hypothetical protein EHSB41UT_02386 [Parendozoicomonas haliclonae]
MASKKQNTFKAIDAEKGILDELTNEQAEAILDLYSGVTKLPKETKKPILLTKAMGLADAVINSDAYRKDLDFTYQQHTLHGLRTITVSDPIRSQVSQMLEAEQDEELEVLAEAMTAWSGFIKSQLEAIREYKKAKGFLSINISKAEMTKRTADAAKRLVSQKINELQTLHISEQAYELLLKNSTSDVEREIAEAQLETVQAKIKTAMENQNLQSVY